MTCSTRGSRAGSGRLQRWGGPKRHRQRRSTQPLTWNRLRHPVFLGRAHDDDGPSLLKEVPFKRVLLARSLVDETGEKMSKVKGNVIDPIDLMRGATFEEDGGQSDAWCATRESLAKFKKAYPSAAQMGLGFPAFGTDAVRMTLTSYSPATKRIPLAPKRIEGYRHFCNKMWNTTRFALPYMEGVTLTGDVPEATTLANRWILSRLSVAIDNATKGLEEYASMMQRRRFITSSGMSSARGSSS
ncbi:MAG: class I tRNA ligase family protein [Polyangiaceae bacterium]